ncbi:uncharacterized protein PpBr36_06125 [Pyricularia pennisetigena]|uniref:uncharacterized protein n=1 Tax=Pyricularia pennisetigena TaxID=1578925 RepID=UPI0011541C1B|nr:uncharacterized protein PpBr36_06125 [Pyricularia pennisetigena]TLS23037.1 hypothetical protein PpBr36_06125 [Pyricularia pennisetigena]
MAPQSSLQPTTSSEPPIKPPIIKQHGSTPNPVSPSSTGPQQRFAAPNDNAGVVQATVSQPNATDPKPRIKMKRTSGIQASRIGHVFKTSALVRSISPSNVRQTHFSPALRTPARAVGDLTDEDENEDELRSTSVSSSNLGKRDRDSADDLESDICASNVKKVKDLSAGNKQAGGALIPEDYTTQLQAGKHMWPCPVRRSGVESDTLTDPGDHFSTSHHSTTFNDNRDGSLSKIGTHGRSGEELPGIVVPQVRQNTNKKDSARTNNEDSLKSREKLSIGLSSDRPEYGVSAPSKENGRQETDFFSFKQKHDGNLDTPSRGREQSLKEHFQLRDYHPSQRESAGTPISSQGSTPALVLDQAAMTRQRSPVALEANSTRRLIETPIPIPTRGHKLVHRADPHNPMKKASPERRNAGLDVSIHGQNASSNSAPANAESAWEFCLKYIQNYEHRRKIPEKQYVKEFLQLPFVREMQWNEEWLKDHPWKDSVPRDISSLLMHRSGEISTKTCERCASKSGPYVGCITIPLGLSPASQSMIYSCSNCLYHGNNAKCSIKEQLKAEFHQRFPDFDRKEENMQSQKQLEKDRRANPPELADPDPLSPASAETVVTRNRGHSMNYNLKKLSQNSMGVSRSRPSRARSREAPDPLNADDEEPEASSKLRPPRNSNIGINGASGRKVSHVPLPSRLPSKGTGVLNQVASAPSAAIDTSAKSLDDKMETWEVGPGFVRNEESDKIAFSTAYLNGLTSVHIADGVSCRLEFLKAGCSRTFDAEDTLRICWVSSGKVEVELDGKRFSVGGPGGIIKLNKGSKAVVFNNRYIDACLQITAVAVED